MNSIKWLTASVIVFATVAMSGALFPVNSQEPPTRTVIELVDPNEKGSFQKFVDLGKSGPSPGDFLVSKDLLLDPETCEKAAETLGRSQLIKFVGKEKEDGFDIADLAILLPDGKITITFPTRFSEDTDPEGASGAITGGTGAYKDARGEATFIADQDGCDQEAGLFTLDLLIQ